VLLRCLSGSLYLPQLMSLRWDEAGFGIRRDLCFEAPQVRTLVPKHVGASSLMSIFV
jgi:hypothetical protein